MTRRRYAQIGLGGRSRMYTHAVVEEYAETSEMVALCGCSGGASCSSMMAYNSPPGAYSPATAARNLPNLVAEVSTLVS